MMIRFSLNSLIKKLVTYSFYVCLLVLVACKRDPSGGVLGQLHLEDNLQKVLERDPKLSGKVKVHPNNDGDIVVEMDVAASNSKDFIASMEEARKLATVYTKPQNSSTWIPLPNRNFMVATQNKIFVIPGWVEVPDAINFTGDQYEPAWKDVGIMEGDASKGIPIEFVNQKAVEYLRSGKGENVEGQWQKMFTILQNYWAESDLEGFVKKHEASFKANNPGMEYTVSSNTDKTEYYITFFSQMAY